MGDKNYNIHYGMHLVGGRYKSGEIKVKNSMSEIHAQVKLEKYLKKKNPYFEKMVVYSVKPDLDTLLGQFSDIFKF